MFPGPYITGSIAAFPPNITTKWYNTQTTFLPPTTKTITANLTAASLIAARTAYCPFTSEDILDGRSEADLPDNCQALLEPYCYPDPNAPVPKSTVFPASCTPQRDATSTTRISSSTPTSKATASPSNTKPSPLQPSTIATCKQYYQVLSGDFCYSIAQKFSITLDQVRCFSPPILHRYIPIPLVIAFLAKLTCTFPFSSTYGIPLWAPIAMVCSWGITSAWKPNKTNIPFYVPIRPPEISFYFFTFFSALRTYQLNSGFAFFFPVFGIYRLGLYMCIYIYIFPPIWICMYL